MRRDFIIGIVVILAVIIGVAFYAVTRSTPAKAPGTNGIGITLPANGNYTEHTPYYDMAVNYPTTTPLAGDANASAITLIKNFVAGEIAQFKTGSDTTHKDTLQITYLIGSSARTLSYIFTIYENIGGVHDMYFHTFVFDTTTGQKLSLADLFLPGTHYLDILSRISRAELPNIIGNSMTNPATIASGTTPDGRNFSNFFFDNNDFVLLFPPYQVASYAAGPQTLRIPPQKLSRILKPEF